MFGERVWTGLGRNTSDWVYVGHAEFLSDL